MDEHVLILVIAVLMLFYGYISRWLATLNISGPMIFTGFGLLLSPIGLNIITVDIDAHFVTILAEIALVLVLFSDAALLDLNLLKKSWKLPARLLFIGLPLTVVLGTLAAWLIFPNQPDSYLILLALLLTPTDAALGKAVVTDIKVSKTIRSTINVESGLNDGIIFPMLIAVVAIITKNTEHGESHSWLSYVAEQIIFGALVGAVIGYVGAKLQIIVSARDWMENNYQNLIPIALAILAFYMAEKFSGNGFIAAFFAGLYAGNTCEVVRSHIDDFADSEGELFVLISFFMFGLVFVPQTLSFVTVKVIVYALLSLTLLRILPVMISLIGSKLDFSTTMFIAWFGPRGIASILYVLIVTHEVGGTIVGFETTFATVTTTVLMSILAHGLTAQPFATWYAKRHKNS